MMASVSRAAELNRCETSRLANLATHDATSGEHCMTQPLANSENWKPRRSSRNSLCSRRNVAVTSAASVSTTSASSSAEMGSRVTVNMASSFWASENSSLINVNPSDVEVRCLFDPFDPHVAEGRTLTKVHQAEFAEFEQRQEVHNDLDATAERFGERSKREYA